ncbi:MAG: hypothetical protein DRN81_02690 [Thermoproteota archaeon]|nr:MAG: hypothetical protein DRN81_02690 [Candidatus Korarchaeota archaeon]
MVTVEEVRHYLNDISSEQISDEVIRTQIRIAEAIIENVRSEKATQQLIEEAVLAKAGELTYIAYTTEMERGLGVLPPAVATHIEDLKRIANMFIEFVKRGAPAVPVTAFTLSGTLWESVTDAT